MALADLKQATAKAIELLKGRCPVALTSTPTTRIETVRQRLVLMLQAVRTVTTPMEALYALLNDEQKARFNGLVAPNDGQSEPHNTKQVCTESERLVETVEPALEKFYDALTVEQKSTV